MPGTISQTVPATRSVHELGLRALARDTMLVVLGALLVALAAQVKLPTWWGVPFSGQTFAVLVVAAALGSMRGSASLALYLCLGIAGAPVFATGGSLLMTIGYLAGFLASAAVVGAMAENGWTRTWSRTVCMLLVGAGIILACGAGWLALIAGLGHAQAVAGVAAGGVAWWVLVHGVLVFVPGEAVKVAVAAPIVRAARRGV